MIAPHVPVVPWTEKPVYRVLVSPVFEKRECGGWTATGEKVFATRKLTRALRESFNLKRSCVVEANGIVLAHNGCKALVSKRLLVKGGFQFGRHTVN